MLPLLNAEGCSLSLRTFTGSWGTRPVAVLGLEWLSLATACCACLGDDLASICTNSCRAPRIIHASVQLLYSH